MNKHATTGGIRNEAESETAAWKKLKEQCQDLFKQYIAYCSSHFEKWIDMIKRSPADAYLMDKATCSFLEKFNFSKYCDQKNHAVVGKYIDILSRWKEYHKMFPNMFPSAIIWISKPAMNAFQERVFSISSWFNSNHLVRPQTAKTFAMCVLECIMRNLHKNIIESEKYYSNKQGCR